MSATHPESAASYRLRTAVSGSFQVGKSLLMGCLLGEQIPTVGDGSISTTHAIGEFTYADSLGPVELFDDGHRLAVCSLDEYRAMSDRRPAPPLFAQHTYARFRLPHPLLRDVDLIDTPGVDSTGRYAGRDDRLALREFSATDLFLVVVPNRMLDTTLVERVLKPIRSAEKPFALLMNCCLPTLPFHPADAVNQRTASAIAAQLKAGGFAPARIDGVTPVYVCNFMLFCISTFLPSSTAPHRPFVEDETLRIRRHFERQHLAMPAPADLRQQSNVPAILDFLQGSPRLAISARETAALAADIRAWKQALRTAPVL